MCVWNVLMWRCLTRSLRPAPRANVSITVRRVCVCGGLWEHAQSDGSSDGARKGGGERKRCADHKIFVLRRGVHQIIRRDKLVAFQPQWGWQWRKKGEEWTMVEGTGGRKQRKNEGKTSGENHKRTKGRGKSEEGLYLVLLRGWGGGGRKRVYNVKSRSEGEVRAFWMRVCVCVCVCVWLLRKPERGEGAREGTAASSVEKSEDGAAKVEARIMKTNKKIKREEERRSSQRETERQGSRAHHIAVREEEESLPQRFTALFLLRGYTRMPVG